MPAAITIWMVITTLSANGKKKFRQFSWKESWEELVDEITGQSKGVYHPGAGVVPIKPMVPKIVANFLMAQDIVVHYSVVSVRILSVVDTQSSDRRHCDSSDGPAVSAADRA